MIKLFYLRGLIRRLKLDYFLKIALKRSRFYSPKRAETNDANRLHLFSLFFNMNRISLLRLVIVSTSSLYASSNNLNFFYNACGLFNQLLDLEKLILLKTSHVPFSCLFLTDAPFTCCYRIGELTTPSSYSTLRAIHHLSRCNDARGTNLEASFCVIDK